jgi:epoxyqueuosine reductase
VTIKTQIKALAAEVGYAACGIAGTQPFEDYRAALQDRITRFPEAAELYRELEGRVEPRAVAPWARSIVVCVRHYGKYAIPDRLVGLIARNYLCDRRIKACPDNGMPGSMKAGLKRLGLRVKTGGVPGRAAAVRAGVAGFGRNNFAYADGCGSWINIESWMVDAEMEADTPAAPAPCPEGCRACIKACPTGALCEPYVMRQDRCTAYLTFEAPEPIAPELWEKMGKWIYGCDVCQQACPMNKGKWERREPTPWLDEVLDQLTPEALAAMDQETYRKVVFPLFSYISEDNLARWHANARRAVEAGGKR